MRPRFTFAPPAVFVAHFAKDIVRRWHQLFKPKDVTLKYLEGQHLDAHEQYQVNTLVDAWRARLHDLS